MVLRRAGWMGGCAALLSACAPRPLPPPSLPSAITDRAADFAKSVPHVAASGMRDASEQAFVDSVLARMTLPEKLGQLTQYAGQWGQTGPRVETATEDAIRRGEVGSFLSVWGADVTRRLQRIAVEESRLGIPILFSHDVIHGFRTLFPVPLAEAASWDPDVARESARIAAAEASAYGIAWTFAPMMDVARDARWGRVVEGAGEDPHLGSVMAAARVRGFQGTDLRAPLSIAATAKHFAAYGAAEGGRDYNIADIPERTLRETYLPPFRAAVCAGAATFMASFNEIGGVPAHASRALQTDVLRGEWGFNGMVVSDWGGLQELIPHGVAAGRADAARLGLRAGVDMDMVSEVYLKELPAEIAAGRVPMAEVDEAVRRVLRLKYRLGLFANPYARGDTSRELPAGRLPAEHRRAAYEAAARSVVLLRNAGGVLPLDRARIRRLAVIGPLAADRHSPLGSWNGAGRDEDVVPVLDGIRRAAGSGITVDYTAGVDSVRSTSGGGFAAAVRAARAADAVVLVVGETEDMTGEASSRVSLDLPGAQRELVEAVRAAAGRKPVAVVLMNGRPLALEWMHDTVPAIVEAWFGGVEMGNAVGDVLFGEVNPGGKLPMTFPRATGQVPIYYNYRQTGRPADPRNEYTTGYERSPSTPLYPFGHGLSYTRFTYGAPRLSAARMGAGDTLSVTVEVTNAGGRAGDEVVQLYVRDPVAAVTRPVKELRGFRRIRLNPGETRAVTFRLTVDDLAFWDAAPRRIAEPGAFVVQVGGSSEQVQSAEFELVTVDGGAIAVPERCGAA
ncbi:glycosyl hydrolase [Longimicrobium terrae]|nr:glycoside hydrolase family 3 N-terminal domain-containing protein [Longimicrobium terrae]NNC31754.1 glycosyl hydrolase [Longimicrobium terrae]